MERNTTQHKRNRRTVHIAKAGRLPLFRVVQPSGPIDGNVRLLPTQLHGTVHAGTRVQLAEFVEPVKDGTIGRFAGVEALHGGGVLSTIVGSNFGEKLDVIFRMELGHLSGNSRMRPVAVHLFVQTVAEDEMVGQLEAVRFHRVRRSIVKERLCCYRGGK